MNQRFRIESDYGRIRRVVNNVQKGLSQQDVKLLCDAAQEAWENAGDKTRKVTFTWKNKRYQSTLTNFRMLVKTLSGEEVACRFL